MSRRVRLSGRAAVIALTTVLAGGLLVFAAPAAAQDDQSVTVQLDELDDSGVSGTAELTADGDQTTVLLTLEGVEEGYEGHIFDSTCDDHQAAAVFYALDAVDSSGTSETDVDAPLSDLTNGDYWVHIHEPADLGGDGVACGQVQAYEGTGGNLPDTGVGPFSGNSSQGWLFAGLVGALGALGASTLLRRYGAVRG